ncbi:MAG TPA: hypothetical protein VNU46_03970 [Gemmatimonadaceae bacterium]|jgi:hypothetical protein|nr:hypothetical protein [Gemmatimonadaceae bacterium]
MSAARGFGGTRAKKDRRQRNASGGHEKRGGDRRKPVTQPDSDGAGEEMMVSSGAQGRSMHTVDVSVRLERIAVLE